MNVTPACSFEDHLGPGSALSLQFPKRHVHQARMLLVTPLKELTRGRHYNRGRVCHEQICSPASLQCPGPGSMYTYRPSLSRSLSASRSRSSLGLATASQPKRCCTLQAQSTATDLMSAEQTSTEQTYTDAITEQNVPHEHAILLQGAP